MLKSLWLFIVHKIPCSDEDKRTQLVYNIILNSYYKVSGIDHST